MNGIVLVNKPKGITSHDVVSRLRKQLKTAKIGHTGTLDPMATGLLVVCVGNATKMVKYLLSDSKEYLAEITFGVQTDTDDITGEVISQISLDNLEQIALKQSLDSFLGVTMQIPPVASAIKINGKRAYEFVHKHLEKPEMEPREITIFEIEQLKPVTKVENCFVVSLRILCSKGTYIRALARDLGQKLGIPSTLSSLVRTKVGSMALTEADELENITQNHVTFHDPLDYLGFPSVTVDDYYRQIVLHGAFLPLDLFKTYEETLVKDAMNHPLAIYTYDSTKNIMRLSVLL